MDSGISPPFEAFYIESMLWHTRSARRSIDLIGDWLQLVRDDDQRALELSWDELFANLHNILIQGGAISRYLFPARKQPVHSNRAVRLCEGLDVTETSPLASRRLRDAVEHFDERLDRYLEREQVGQFIPQDVGYSVPTSDVPLHIFNGFYTHKLVFVLLGEEFEMAPIVKEIERLHEALSSCAASGSRLPYRKILDQNA